MAGSTLYVCIARCRPSLRHSASRTNRCFSLLSVHRTFPATLHRFQLQRGSQLYEHKLKKDDDDFSDAVKLSDDGLIRPGSQSCGMSSNNLLVPSVLLKWHISLKRSFFRAEHMGYAWAVRQPLWILLGRCQKWQTSCWPTYSVFAKRLETFDCKARTLHLT